MGKGAYGVLSALFELGPSTAAELADWLKISQDAVRKQLRKLEERGKRNGRTFVKRVGKRGRAVIWAIDEMIAAKLREVAEECDTAGKMWEIAAKHGEERREFKRLREERMKRKKREAEAHPFTLTYHGEQKADNAVKYVVISFSERRKQDRPDFIDLDADFEAELNIKTRKAQMSKEEVQFWFRYDGELEEKRWVFEEYGAEVVLRVGLPDLEEGRATKNEIAPLTPERLKAFISWFDKMTSQSGR